MSDIPLEIDTSQPHPARMYDYYLGGENNFAVDREAAENVLAGMPSGRTFARENRAFLGRAVRFVAGEAGIRQFLDIGAGLPAANSVHEVAQAIAPDCRVVYSDNDPLVLAHARSLLTSSPEGRTGYIHADLRDPEAILASDVAQGILDFGEPIALMLVAILHFLPDDDEPADIIRTLLDALPAGSYLVASHLTGEHDRTGMEAAGQAYQKSKMRGQARDRDEFARLAFSGLRLVRPGVVLVSEWRPEQAARPAPAEVNCYGGVAQKR